LEIAASGEFLFPRLVKDEKIKDERFSNYWDVFRWERK
jgi:hypothetical protein